MNFSYKSKDEKINVKVSHKDFQYLFNCIEKVTIPILEIAAAFCTSTNEDEVGDKFVDNIYNGQLKDTIDNMVKENKKG